MKTQCTSSQLEFVGLGSRQVVAHFSGDRVSTDGGILLLRELEKRSGMLRRLSSCFKDYRDPRRVDHTVEELIRQRVFALACGYEDLNDHDTLRDDPLLALAVGKKDPLGRDRSRERDRGHALAGRSTLNRLELTLAKVERDERYKKISYDGSAIESYFVDIFLDAHGKMRPKQIILDLDATDDPLHGKQERRFFHGYYRCYCYLPLYITCGAFLLAAKLRPSNIDGAFGAVEELERIVAQIRKRWPKTEIVIRADSGFSRDALMDWCESNSVHFVLGLAQNKRLKKEIEGELRLAALEAERTGLSARRFRDFRYRTLNSWTRERRVVGKAEQIPGKANPRFIVTSLPLEQIDGRRLYEKVYCQRGDMENRIKEQQLDLFADRTSAGTMRANQLRLWFSSVAYVLINELRRVGLKNTRMARAQCGTIRNRLIKVGGLVRVSVRRVATSLSSAFPLKDVFAEALINIQGAYPLLC